jgi:hypothetical protein
MWGIRDGTAGVIIIILINTFINFNLLTINITSLYYLSLIYNKYIIKKYNTLIILNIYLI